MRDSASPWSKFVDWRRGMYDLLLDKFSCTPNSLVEKAVLLLSLPVVVSSLRGVPMPSIKSPIVPAIFLAVFFLTTAAASADPITVGTITYVSSSPSTFSLGGPGLAVNGTTSQLISSVSLLSNGLMTPGSSGLTGGSLDSQDDEFAVQSPITAQGVSYSPGAALLALRFSSSTFTAPVAPASGFVVIAPFQLTSGLLEGYPNNLGDVPLFSVPLTGQGTTTLTFAIENGIYRLRSQTFTFGSTVQGVTVQSIPEPTSALMIFSGILALAGYRKRTIS